MILALLLVGVVLRLQPPPPVGADAPPGRFAEARARDHLAVLFGDEAPTRSAA